MKRLAKKSLKKEPGKAPAAPRFLNAAAWPALPAEQRAGFHEGWYFKINDPANGRALWVRFTLLTTRNGFKREASVWAVLFERNRDTGEVRKVAVRQTQDISAFQSQETPSGVVIRIADSELTPSGSKGCVASKGKEIRWDLQIAPRVTGQPAGTFSLLPEGLQRSGLSSGRIVTVGENLSFTGTVTVDGKPFQLQAAPGMQGHLSHSRGGHSWAWSHCNSFVNENGQPVDAVFEGLTVRATLAGLMRSPRFSSFYFRYRGEEHCFNSLWNALHSRSDHSLNEWTFKAERGDLVFRGKIRAQYRDFAGITLEDTDGSLLYCANSKLSDLELHVYRKGKLEATLRAPGSAAFEVVDRELNPYVPLLI